MAVLLMGLSVMAILMTIAMPVWKHDAQREKETELVFRGEQYGRALTLFQRKRGPGVDAAERPGAARRPRPAEAVSRIRSPTTTSTWCGRAPRRPPRPAQRAPTSGRGGTRARTAPRNSPLAGTGPRHAEHQRSGRRHLRFREQEQSGIHSHLQRPLALQRVAVHGDAARAAAERRRPARPEQADPRPRRTRSRSRRHPRRRWTRERAARRTRRTRRPRWTRRTRRPRRHLRTERRRSSARTVSR